MWFLLLSLACRDGLVDSGEVEEGSDQSLLESTTMPSCEDPGARESLGAFYQPELGEDWEAQRTATQGSAIVHGQAMGIGDMNLDGRVDILLGQKSGLQLYLQDEDGQLRDRSEQIWAHPELQKGSWLISVLDLNDDGRLDFFLGRDGRNGVYFNHRGTHFSEFDLGLGMVEQLKSVTTSASFGDLDRDGDLDLALGLESSGQVPPQIGDPDQLFIQTNHSFVSQPERLVEELRHGYTYGAPLMDMDNDGWLDLYVMNHMSDSANTGVMYQNHALRNVGKGQFEVWEGTGLDVTIASMGSDVVDLNGDGFMDIMIAGVLENMLLVSADGPTWYREDFARGMTFDGSDDRYTAWASTFADLDNDSLVDVVVGFGPSVVPMEEEPELQPDAIWMQQADGSFEQVAEEWGLAQESFTKSLAVFDYNSDGWLDILKSEFEGPAELWLARCGEERFIDVELSGVRGDPHGIGSRVAIEIGDQTQTRWIHSQATGLITSVPFEAHFGVGDAEYIDRLTVYWLDGTTQSWQDLPTQQRIRVHHP